MSLSPAQRVAIRTRFAGRCGYCGVSETMVGNELEINHIVETVSGQLVGLTARGWFHIRWLHLNRPLLISFRQLQQREQMEIEAISQAQETTFALQHRIETLESELADLRAAIMRIVGSANQE